MKKLFTANSFSSQSNILIIALLLLFFQSHVYSQGCGKLTGNTYIVNSTNSSGPGSLLNAIINANNDNVGGFIVLTPSIGTLTIIGSLPIITVDSLEISSNSGVVNIHAISCYDPIFAFFSSAPHSCVTADLYIYGSTAKRFYVYNTNDSGPGSLREAIEFSNQSNSEDFIDFDIPGQGPHVFTPASPYIVQNGFTIDGSTQPANGYTGNAPKIEFNGGDSISTCFSFAKKGSSYPKLSEAELSGCNIHNFNTAILVDETNRFTALNNVISNNHQFGICISNTMQTTIGSNKIGLDTSGMVGAGNGTGIRINGTSNFDYIGLNIISDNDLGLSVEMSNNVFVVKNKIGTNAIGDSVIGNQLYGIESINSNNIFIGSSNSNAGNIICGNTLAGIIITSNGSGKDTIMNNIIGLKTINDSLPNGNGIIIESQTDSVVVLNNTISGNLNYGILINGNAERNIVQSNNINNNISDGIHCIGRRNTCTENSIWDNGNKGINLDSIGNDNITPPVILYAGFNEISGTALPFAKIELFHSDTNLNPEGKLFIDDTIADIMGNWRYSGSNYNTSDITATQTDLQGNTSEFSEVIPSVNLGPDTVICTWGGGQYTLSAGTDLIAQWWSTQETSATITVYTTGYYSVIALTVLGDTLFDTVYVYFVPCMGINELTEKHFVVFPNPSHETITIAAINNFSPEGFILQIDNVLGVPVYSVEVNQDIFTINITNFLSKGIYFLHMMEKKGKYSNCQKIVIE